MKIAVNNRESCMGCGFCATCCSEVFRMAEDGLAEVIGEMNEENEDILLAVIENCPVKIFRLE